MRKSIFETSPLVQKAMIEFLDDAAKEISTAEVDTATAEVDVAEEIKKLRNSAHRMADILEETLDISDGEKEILITAAMLSFFSIDKNTAEVAKGYNNDIAEMTKSLQKGKLTNKNTSRVIVALNSALMEGIIEKIKIPGENVFTPCCEAETLKLALGFSGFQDFIKHANAPKLGQYFTDTLATLEDANDCVIIDNINQTAYFAPPPSGQKPAPRRPSGGGPML